MSTRVFLAAGAAALAIAAPAYAAPGGGHGGGEQHGGGGPHGGGGGEQHGGGGPHGGGDGGPHGGGGPPAFSPARGGGGGGPHGGGGPPAFAGGGRGHFGSGGAPVFEGFRGGGPHGGGGGPRFAARQSRAPYMHSFARQQTPGVYAREGRVADRQQAHSFARQQVRMSERRHGYNYRGQEFRMAERLPSRSAHQELRAAARQQGHGFARQQAQNRAFQPQQLRNNEPVMQQAFTRQQLQGNRFPEQPQSGFTARGAAQFPVNTQYANAYYGSGGNGGLINGCPPGLWAKNNGCMPPGQAASLLGTPVAQAAGIVPLGLLPQPLSYYYPDTSDYYWRYGDGYLYQVDRADNVIAALLPLLAGGYLPGQYLPPAYMADYVPDYYGFDAFYPDYGDVCNRYYDGVIYQADCNTGLVEDVIPMYAGGYGVGQLLPTSYSYYNVPIQYRSLYYDTPDTAYWYAPGAIYQYDPRTSIITSVAALMSPGFAIGQPLPVGYDAYNVPLAYRGTYYDTPTAWYRYSNGYIYQVDPVTQLVTAIVASLLS